MYRIEKIHTFIISHHITYMDSNKDEKVTKEELVHEEERKRKKERDQNPTSLVFDG